MDKEDEVKEDEGVEEGMKEKPLVGWEKRKADYMKKIKTETK